MSDKITRKTILNKEYKDYKNYINEYSLVCVCVGMHVRRWVCVHVYIHDIVWYNSMRACA